LGIKGFQRFIDDTADQAKQVVAGDPALRSHVAEKSVPSLIVAKHPKPPLDVGSIKYRTAAC
jgi:hypothetical protein